MTVTLKPTDADTKIAECIAKNISFSVIAGAGSGKTTSLVETLKGIQKSYGKELRKNGQRVVCITYTNRAVGVISSRLGFDDIFFVSTLHGFLWAEIARFQDAIREALRDAIIPQYMEKARVKDNGGTSQTAQKARKDLERLTAELAVLNEQKPPVLYEETVISDYSKCVLNHDDVIDVAAYMIMRKPLLRKGLGFKYPYIFVDEAQDTFPQVVEALNAVCAGEGLPVVGYFGDPMQQIYDKRAGDFAGPEGSEKIPKEENFRSSTTVIDLLNNFRTDLKQVPGGKNADIEGSVSITVVQAPDPAGLRKTYTAEQLDEVTAKFEEAVKLWGWTDDTPVKHLFLARQMIARRLGFVTLHRLFTGDYSSSRSQSDYEDGTHYLLKPFVDGIFQLVDASRNSDAKKLIETLRRISPAFDDTGMNKDKTLKQMLEEASKHATALAEKWEVNTVKEILEYCSASALYPMSERLSNQLARVPRDAYDADDEDHQREKGDWLADDFFKLKADELEKYIDFLDENSPFSTQHGSKGEQYDNVLVMIDDVEAAWNTYSFSKVFTPNVAGDPTERQKELTQKLAYVCFSRAEVNLRILFFSRDAAAAGKELIDQGLFREDQVSYL
ncbi:UvrD-helicase domain-containing protein [Thalassospira xiamenensis]|uniref:DNA helicase II n=1 Tax=Thalassospira xiamenensis TaxID=220697 RepID=A0A367XCB1_9PROT|nr:UvrD-helicase domain-containing protein [Thalassospira xiamenensis]KZB52338.1 DNA helicase II [Thalassospira xiamenensis]RCK51316.1 DNA helicase II [Thalassospira xiamenensis]